MVNDAGYFYSLSFLFWNFYINCLPIFPPFVTPDINKNQSRNSHFLQVTEISINAKFLSFQCTFEMFGSLKLVGFKSGICVTYWPLGLGIVHKTNKKPTNWWGQSKRHTTQPENLCRQFCVMPVAILCQMWQNYSPLCWMQYSVTFLLHPGGS